MPCWRDVHNYRDALIAGYDNTRYNGTHHYRSANFSVLWLGKYMSQLYFAGISVYYFHALGVSGLTRGSAHCSSPRDCNPPASAYERFWG
jgi:hypothetical protein